jgi:hypothetical protein
MKLRNIPKSLALIDTSIFNNCRSISVEDRKLLLKLNAFLYDFNFSVLERFWKHKTYKIRNKITGINRKKLHKLSAELKDDPFWIQIHQVEQFLHQEEQNLKCVGNSSKDIDYCLNCRNIIPFLKDGGIKKKVNEEGCRRDVEMGLCPNIKGRVLWPEEFMS